MAETLPKHWTMKDVQVHLHAILLADHPLTQDQRRSLKAVIEMCDVWNKLSPGFAAVLQDLRARGLDVPCPPTCATVTERVTDEHCDKCKALLSKKPNTTQG